MFKLFIVFTLAGVPTGEGYIGKAYTSEDECRKAAVEIIMHVGPITDGNEAQFVCEKIGEAA